MNSVDRLWLALCVYHEARGEPMNGKVAVCHVILNRAYQRGMSVKDVILQPWQFSWAIGGARPAIKDYDSLESCSDAVDICIAERSAGEYFSHADSYFADTIKQPRWASKITLVEKIGHHIFFQGIK